MKLLTWWRQGSLLSRYAVVSLALTLAFGGVLSAVLSGAVVARARLQAVDAVALSVRLGLQPQLSALDLSQGFDPSRFVQLQETLRRMQDGGVDPLLEDLRGADAVRVGMFDSAGTVVYSDDPNMIGQPGSDADVDAVRTGAVTDRHSTVDGDGAAGRLLDVYVPIFYSSSAAPDGIIKVSVPYEPIAGSARADVRRLNVALLGCLVLFYGALFRLVATASRRLRRQTDELRAHAESSEHQALHDSLTGLPNRVLFLDRADRALTGAAQRSTHAAVMLIDLDRFKEVNDTLGHSYGDEVLRQVGARLREVLREVDTLARLGGDEFAVLMPTVTDSAQAQVVAERLRDALHVSFWVEGESIDVEASIGVALAPQHGGDSTALLRNADAAMYTAKEHKAGAVLFDPDSVESAPSRLSVLGDLRRALENDDELFLQYQPKVELTTEHIDSAEALLRWRHPTRGFVPPTEFIPVAEGSGIIIQVTERVLTLALVQLRAWLDEGTAVPVAVNLSPRCLMDAELPARVARLLAEHGVPADLLRLELTESAVMADAAQCLAVLQQLHALGVSLSIDDFGTGYTSMSYLRLLPVDELKIDRSFVFGMTTDPQDAVLVRTAIDLGHNLGLTVVAEGVEGPEHVAALRALGCDVAQGYHYARPLDPPRFQAMLREQQQESTSTPTPAVPCPRQDSNLRHTV